MMPTTQAQANIDLIRRALSAFNAADLDRCVTLMTEDFAINLAGMPFQMRGREAWKSNAEVMQIAFPDIQAQIDDIFAAEDRVAVRLTFRGSHSGEFLGIAPTGRDVVFTSLEIYRVADGQLAEEWISSDLTTLMRQRTEPDAANR
jgi:steroid delta-isomerase-like uncharacterized protein